MFKRQRQFNIISGEKVAFQSDRAYSCTDQRKSFGQLALKLDKIQKLGTARDNKNFQYGYDMQKQIVKTRNRTQQNPINKLPSSMINYVSTKYNIINHDAQLSTAKIADPKNFVQNKHDINRKSPLTGIIHAARLVAPNYHQDYGVRQQNHQFLRKKGMCSGMLNIQKGYAIGKYFRNRK